MIDDVESKGFGLPYLGIKPTAAGVAPVMPVAPTPMPRIPSLSQPIKVPQSPKPSQVATPLPLSQPKPPAVPQAMQTAQAPISNAQLMNPSPSPNPAAPMPMAQPMMPMPKAPMPLMMGDEDESPNLPQSLQMKPEPMQQKAPSFNKLTHCLGRK